MSEELIRQLEEATERGRFQGEVLTSLADIKRVLDDMKIKHGIQDSKIDAKAERSDVEELKKKVWFLSGAASLLGAVIGKIFS